MPQLDIVFISLTYAWAWLTLLTLTSKIQTIKMKNSLESPTPKKPTKLTWNLPWA